MSQESETLAPIAVDAVLKAGCIRLSRQHSYCECPIEYSMHLFNLHTNHINTHYIVCILLSITSYCPTTKAAVLRSYEVPAGTTL